MGICLQNWVMKIVWYTKFKVRTPARLRRPVPCGLAAYVGMCHEKLDLGQRWSIQIIHGNSLPREKRITLKQTRTGSVRHTLKLP